MPPRTDVRSDRLLNMGASAMAFFARAASAGIFAASVSLSTAMAADKYESVPVEIIEPEIVETHEPLFPWTGFYLGVHGGYGEASWSGIHEGDDAPGFISRADDLDLSGALGGVQAGYNHQVGRWVLGLEADVTRTDWSDRVDDVADDDDHVTGEVNWLGSLRARAGLANSRAFVYGTAGLAYADATYAAFDETSSGSVDIGEFGVVAGLGAAFLLRHDITFRVEGLYYRFDDRVNTSALTPDSAAGDFVEFEDALVVRAGLSFLLN